jgi:hypothetical protein
MRAMRFRLRTLMILVAIVGILSGVGVRLWLRSERYDREFLKHNVETLRLETLLAKNQVASSEERKFWARLHWHYQMAVRFHYAAAHPWLPAPVDLPEPE